MYKMFFIICFVLIGTTKISKRQGDHEIKISERGHRLYLRQVLCLGCDGEAVETVCCSGRTFKSPWLVFLPTNFKVSCHVSDCLAVCTRAIQSFRKSKKCDRTTDSFLKPVTGAYLSFIDSILNENYESSTTEGIESLEKVSSNESKKEKTTVKCMSQKMSHAGNPNVIKIPKIVLDLLQLCRNIDRPEYENCYELKAMCKTLDYPLQDFLELVSSPPWFRLPATPFARTSKTYLTDQPLCTCEKASSTEPYVEQGSTQAPNQQSLTTLISKTEPTKAHVNPPETVDTLHVPNLPKIFTTKKVGSKSDNNSSCCCNCLENKLRNMQNEKMKRLLMAILSFPKLSEELIEQPKSGKILQSPQSPEATWLIPKYKTVISVESHVGEINDKYMEVSREYKQAAWGYETNMTQYTREKAMEAALSLSQHQRDIVDSLNLLNNMSITDPILLREIKLLYIPGLSLPPDLHWNAFEQVLYAMQTIYTSAFVNKWENKNTKVTLTPVITHAMATSKNPEELKYYWMEWRNATGKRLRPLFQQYVSLMAMTAQKNGFHDASEMWASRYETEDFIDSLSAHWENIKPLYQELHAFVRHKLHQYYGEINGASNTGKIPAHLTGDIWGKNWKELYMAITPFKSKTNVLTLIETKLRKKMNPLEMAKTSEKTFTALGFSTFSDEFWNVSIFEKNNKVSMNCEPSAWDMYNSKDFRIKMCCQSNIEDFDKIEHLMALCKYYREYSSLPFIFRDGPNPGFPDGLAGAIVLSAKTTSHKKFLEIHYPKQNLDKEIDDLLKLALEKVAFLPYCYILELWRHMVFRGEIDQTNYNTKWWELRARYQGIKPTVERTEEDFDAGSKLHIATSKPYIKYFVSSLMEFQFHEALCKKNHFSGPIHQCDFTNNKESGEVIRKVMGLGASEHWRVAMEKLTGGRRLESTPLLRYFQPLYDWLKENNKENKIVVGWDES